MKIKILVIFFLIVALYQINSKVETKRKPKFYFDLLLGYAVPINASYIDTYKDQDIYWNPNSGININLRFRLMFTETFGLAFPLDVVVGIYQYKTHDGKKINTEAEAETNPETTNTEWSVCPNFTPTIILKPSSHPGCPYFGIGIGVGLLWSWESWSFTNVDDESVLLIILKYYYPSVNVKAELGWNVPLNKAKTFYFNISCTFNLANYIMYKVQLTNYYVDNVDKIGDYDEKSTIYNYSFNSPDENKGGDCLLAGFVYQNYPQQKIGTNAEVTIGFSWGR